MIIQTPRIRCICCDALLPAAIVNIGAQHPSAIFVDKNDPINSELCATSLDVTRCENEECTLVQLCNAYSLQYVFDHYPYESGSTATMRRILQDVVDEVESIMTLDASDVVLDIGGNDGTLLSLFKQPLRARVNIDAAAGVGQLISDSDYIHIHKAFSANAFKKLNLPSPKVITSVAMFYHLNDPLTFCRNVSEIMDDSSVWVLQMTYLGSMLDGNVFDNIVHEHTAYYSLFSLESLLNRVGLHIAEARIVDSYGGSIRAVIVKNPVNFPKEKYRKEYVAVRQLEIERRTNSLEALFAFDTRTFLLKQTIRSILEHLVQQNGPLWGFGASTKGNMILQLLEAGPEMVSCILDNGKKKIGKFMSGSMIPIVDEVEYLESLPKYLFILPYYYTDAFAKIIRKRLKPGQEIHLFVPLPYPRFVSLKGE